MFVFSIMKQSFTWQNLNHIKISLKIITLLYLTLLAKINVRLYNPNYVKFQSSPDNSTSSSKPTSFYFYFDILVR